MEGHAEEARRRDAMNALIVNCSGLGDGMIEVPFLLGLASAAPSIQFFHTRGLLFQNEPFIRALRMPGYAGCVPEGWRKFNPASWRSILSFIEDNHVELLVNLRHIGPRYDRDYFEFKKRHGKNVTFLEYDFDNEPAVPVNIRAKIDALFRSRGLVDHSFDRHYLRRLVPSRAVPIGGRVAINPHTGSEFKRWPVAKWLGLCKSLVRRGCTLTILAGYTAQEHSLSIGLTRELEREFPGRTNLGASTDLIAALGLLSQAECLVSADSWPVHAATAIGVKTIGLYIVSSPIMWGGEPSYAFPAESRHLRACENFDRTLGICKNGYASCPLIEAKGDGIEVRDVVDLVIGCASVC